MYFLQYSQHFIGTNYFYCNQENFITAFKFKSDQVRKTYYFLKSTTKMFCKKNPWPLVPSNQRPRIKQRISTPTQKYLCKFVTPFLHSARREGPLKSGNSFRQRQWVALYFHIINICVLKNIFVATPKSKHCI